MHGRTPGGEASWRPYTPQQLREFAEHDRRIRLENSKRPHAVCHHHGITKRDGSPKAFIEDERGEQCPGSKAGEFDEHGQLLCAPFWQSVPCPMGKECLHR